MRDRLVTWCILLTVLAGCGGDDGGGTSASPESVGTLAYAVTQCRENPIEPSDSSFGQKVQILRRDADPVTVREYSTAGPPPLPGLCQYFGGNRFGTASVAGFPLQRLGVSPDGSRVAFELTDDFSVISQDQVPPKEEGIWVVRSDGGGLQRLADASREPTFHIGADITDSALQNPFFHFSPSGDRITYADRGPDRAGEEAVQIVTLDLRTGERKQVTHLHPQPQSDDPRVFIVSSGPVFLDEQTIGFAIRTGVSSSVAYSVKADGQTEPVPLPPPLTRPGSVIVPGFSITGSAQSVYQLVLPGPSGAGPWELFVSDRENLLQLTNFGRGDTGTEAVFSRDRRRVLFTASADPFGSNPYENCQFFSVNTLGGAMRQLTSFNEGQPSMGGCNLVQPYPLGCFMGIVGHDLHTDTIVFESNCDPLGTNPNGGQIFAMEFDGTGLRQLTHAQGLMIAADGTVTVELPGPAAYPGGP